MKKLIIVAMLVISILIALTGCSTEAEKVSYNISQEADNFNVVRRLVVINARSDKPTMEIVGKFSFTLEPDRIIVVAEDENGSYKKHSIGINEWTIWSIEDLSGAYVNKFKYEVNFLPQSIIPYTVTSNQ
jgi:outer membrane lipoprotein-sorting protein